MKLIYPEIFNLPEIINITDGQLHFNRPNGIMSSILERRVNMGTALLMACKHKGIVRLSGRNKYFNYETKHLYQNI